MNPLEQRRAQQAPLIRTSAGRGGVWDRRLSFFPSALRRLCVMLPLSLCRASFGFSFVIWSEEWRPRSIGRRPPGSWWRFSQPSDSIHVVARGRRPPAGSYLPGKGKSGSANGTRSGQIFGRPPSMRCNAPTVGRLSIPSREMACIRPRRSLGSWSATSARVRLNPMCRRQGGADRVANAQQGVIGRIKGCPHRGRSDNGRVHYFDCVRSASHPRKRGRMGNNRSALLPPLTREARQKEQRTQ